jgi:hypothetical protein
LARFCLLSFPHLFVECSPTLTGPAIACEIQHSELSGIADTTKEPLPHWPFCIDLRLQGAATQAAQEETLLMELNS